MITIINEKSGFSAKSICLTKPDSHLASDGQLVIVSLRKVSRGKTPESGQFSSIQWFSCVRLCATPWTAACQASLSPTPRAYVNSCPLRRWCHPTISPSVIPFSSHLQSVPASGSFQMSQLFTSGDQSIRASAAASVLPMNIQDWFPLG